MIRKSTHQLARSICVFASALFLSTFLWEHESGFSVGNAVITGVLVWYVVTTFTFWNKTRQREFNKEFLNNVR